MNIRDFSIEKSTSLYGFDCFGRLVVFTFREPRCYSCLLIRHTAWLDHKKKISWSKTLLWFMNALCIMLIIAYWWPARVWTGPRVLIIIWTFWTDAVKWARKKNVYKPSFVSRWTIRQWRFNTLFVAAFCLRSSYTKSHRRLDHIENLIKILY